MNYFELYFKYPVNQSLQEGDTVYSLSTSGQGSSYGGFATTNDLPLKIGTVIKIQHFDTDGDEIFDTTRVIIDLLPNVPEPQQPAGPNALGTYIMFYKPREVNEATVKGYFGALTMSNDSREKAELFVVSCDAAISS